MALVNINGLNVATVYVTDLNSTVAFYSELLGFEKVMDRSPGVLLHSKGANLTLYVQGGRESRPTAAGNFSHLSLCFNAAEGVKTALEKIEKAGVKVLMKYGDFNGDFAGFQFEDPSGNVLEFAGKP